MESYNSQQGYNWNKYQMQPTKSYEGCGWNSYSNMESSKPQWSSKVNCEEVPSYYNWNEKPLHHLHSEKPHFQHSEKLHFHHSEKPHFYQQQEEKCQYLQGEKPQYIQGEKPERFYMKQMEGVYGDWEKICDNLEQMKMEARREKQQQEVRGQWNNCEGSKCCDEEMINMVKEMINCLIGAEQSYIQLGFLCMDEKLTLTNTAEYFRLCGLRMRWLAHGLIGRSVRLFNVNEWINNTTFENWFKVPSKEELSTNDYTSVIKTFFNISMKAEERLVEKMHLLGEKMTKVDWMNAECRFDGFKWFVNFVLPYQMHFVREMNMHLKNIEMCNNGYIFDKCEMRPLVQKIEEFIHRLVKSNENIWTSNKCEKKMVVIRKNY